MLDRHVAVLCYASVMGARRKTTLKIVEKPDANASTLAFERGKGITGNENEDLLCGGCATILGRGVSQETLGMKFKVPAQLLIQCWKCKKHNRLNAITGN